jgi:hypothetical protein
MGWSPNGEEYHLYSRQGQIFNYTKQEVVFEGLERGHDIHFLDNDRLIVNESKFKRALLLNLADKTKTVLHTVPNRGKDTLRTMWGFTRGIAASKDLIFLGSSPLGLHIFDKQLNPVEDWQVSTTPIETIFDICLDPRDWNF